MCGVSSSVTLQNNKLSLTRKSDIIMIVHIVQLKKIVHVSSMNCITLLIWPTK